MAFLGGSESTVKGETVHQLSRLPDAAGAVTTSLTINFLQKPAAVDLLAEGQVLKLGRRLAVMEVSLYSVGRPDPVAHVTGTYALPPS